MSDYGGQKRPQLPNNKENNYLAYEKARQGFVNF